MSRRIDDAVEMLSIINQLHETQPGKDLAQLRTKTIAAVAAARGVDRKTIADVYVRRLTPYVKNAAEFDAILGRWLSGHPAELKAVLKKRALDPGGCGRVKDFFWVDQVRKDGES